MSNTDGYFSLGSDINKVSDPKKQEVKEGASTLLPELELSMSEEELLRLAGKWKGLWDPFWKTKIQPKCEKNEKYWKGETAPKEDWLVKEDPMADNVIFSALEAFLPMATKQNPDPVVTSDNTNEGNALAEKVKLMLINVADKNSLKLQLKQLMRFWALYKLGIAKIGWNAKKNDIEIQIIRPHKIILDPNATIVNGWYTGEYIGEYRKDTASRMVIRFPKKKDLISELVNDDMGTEVTYLEWWTNDYLFWTIKGKDGYHILDKVKNPHWNYDEEKDKTDAFGNVTKEKVTGRNQFSSRMMPYAFLSVYNLGMTPFDETGMIEQSIATQDLINKRVKQIDRNADATNGGLFVSGDHFTKEQAAQVADVATNGGTVWIPSGSVEDAVKRDIAPSLPPYIYQSLQDYRGIMRETFGVVGSTAALQGQQKTVRGKVMAKTADMDRVGNGVSEFLEQTAENIYNWCVQLMFVYYDEPHTASVMGKQRAMEYVKLVNTDMNRELTVSIKEGSMIPKDSMSKRQEAIELFSAGAIDPITLFEKLEFSDPYATAKQAFIWKTQPQALFPDLQGGQPQPGQGAPPGQPPQAPPDGGPPPVQEGQQPQVPPQPGI